MGEHTPGPWWAGKGETGAWFIQSGDPGTFEAPWADGRGTVAVVKPGETAQANARLITAAPELEAALLLTQRTCHGSFEEGWTVQLTGHEMLAIEAALKRARPA